MIGGACRRAMAIAGLVITRGAVACGTPRIFITATPTADFPIPWGAETLGTWSPISTTSPARLRQNGRRCAALPIETQGFDTKLSKVLDEVLLSELQASGFVAVGPDDINAILGMERLKDAAGCDDSVRMGEIGGAFGVDYLVTGRLAVVQDEPLVTVKLMDVRRATVVARVAKMGQPDVDEKIASMLVDVVRELVRSSKL